MASKVLTVILGDLVHSRESKGRQELSRRIHSALIHLRHEFTEEFYAPLVLTRGVDELSGVLKRPNMSYRICTLLNARMSPRLIRFAIVRGNVDIAVTSKDARRMDGPAFHAAADLLAKAKTDNLYYYFKLGFEFSEIDPWLTEIASLLHIIRSGWSDRQRRVANLYVKLGSQEAVADRLRITQQAVSDVLRRAHRRELKRAEDLIAEVLERGGKPQL
ncbi:MAG: SatD family protein [bacterium]|nr:SatD family protein [bacterium]